VNGYCGTKPGDRHKRRPKRSPGDRYDVASYRRAIHRACDAAFPPDGDLAKRPDQTAKECHRRLTESQRAELRNWQSAHRWSPNRLRHAAATEIRQQFGLEAAQIALGHSRADVTQVYAERDLAKGVEVARKIG
jgi:hypothetical protein